MNYRSPHGRAMRRRGEAFRPQGFGVDRVHRERCSGRSHLDVFLDLFPLRHVRVFGHGEADRTALCKKRTENLGLMADDCNEPRRGVEGADVVVWLEPMSSGLEPFLETACVKPGGYVNLIDLARTRQQETLDQFDRIIIEDAAQEAEMADQMIRARLIGDDLLDLVTGRI